MLEVSPAKLPLALYTALMACEPTLSELVVKVALPLALSEVAPKVVEPSKNCTSPVGIAPVADVTVSVNVTVRPAVWVLGLATSEPKVVIGLMTSLKADEVLVTHWPRMGFTKLVKPVPLVKSGASVVASGL